MACAGTASTPFDPDAATIDPDADPQDDGGSGPLTERYATGITVSEIAIYQAIKIDLMKGGTVVAPTAPIIQHRAGLVRAFVTTDGDFTAKDLTGKLVIRTGGKAALVKAARTISGASVEADSTTTFDFNIDGGMVGADSTYTLTIVETGVAGTETNVPSRFPRDGSEQALGAVSSGALVKIKLFPIQLSNGLTGDSDSSTVDAWLKQVRKIYPIPNVEITVQPTVTYNGSVPLANGQNWDQLLNALTQKRQTDKLAADVYYYGVFKPNASFAAFCPSGCVAGLSNLSTNVSDSWARSSIGLGYGGGFATGTGQTMAHEIGHAHGRNHSPCGGAQGVDPNFPDPTAGIGTWGYDVDTGAIFGPNGENIQGNVKPKDIMGYCDPKWISAYTYKALYTRIAAINGAGMSTAYFDAPLSYRMIRVLPDGTTTIGDHFDVNQKLFGEEKTVTITLKNGTQQTVTGNYYEYDHLPGGYVMVPEALESSKTITRAIVK
ncbi:hypothetical protein BH09MYX1_BH09MYX1_45790 [soil metagenome]